MFKLNDDLSIYATRGDTVFFKVGAYNEYTETNYAFQPGDTVRIKIFGKKNPGTVYLEKSFAVTEECEQVTVYLGHADMRFGELISKPTDYWYEVELNPDTEAQTIIGYDEDGPKIFRLYPEGN